MAASCMHERPICKTGHNGIHVPAESALISRITGDSHCAVSLANSRRVSASKFASPPADNATGNDRWTSGRGKAGAGGPRLVVLSRLDALFRELFRHLLFIVTFECWLAGAVIAGRLAGIARKRSRRLVRVVGGWGADRMSGKRSDRRVVCFIGRFRGDRLDGLFFHMDLCQRELSRAPDRFGVLRISWICPATTDSPCLRKCRKSSRHMVPPWSRKTAPFSRGGRSGSCRHQATPKNRLKPRRRTWR